MGSFQFVKGPIIKFSFLLFFLLYIIMKNVYMLYLLILIVLYIGKLLDWFIQYSLCKELWINILI